MPILLTNLTIVYHSFHLPAPLVVQKFLSDLICVDLTRELFHPVLRGGGGATRAFFIFASTSFQTVATTRQITHTHAPTVPHAPKRLTVKKFLGRTATVTVYPGSGGREGQAQPASLSHCTRITATPRQAVWPRTNIPSPEKCSRQLKIHGGAAAKFRAGSFAKIAYRQNGCKNYLLVNQAF